MKLSDLTTLRIGGEAEPEEHGVPALQHLLRTFCPHPDRVEDEGEGDEDDRGEQHGVSLLAVRRARESFG